LGPLPFGVGGRTFGVMSRGISLTIPARNGRRRGLRLGVSACLLLGACTIEVSAPPEADPPLIAEADKAPPPPAQPSEPQPWSRGLDFDATPVAADRGQMTKGLVAGEAPGRYSGQRLTFESAFDPEKPPSEADLVRQRAQERAKAAGRPVPPEVTPVPVAAVESESLPPAGEAAAPQRRESRLPPPPKFPPVDAKPAPAADAVAADEAPSEAAEPADPSSSVTAREQWAQRNSRLPPPPKFPPAVPAAPAEAAPQQAALPASAAVPEPVGDPAAAPAGKAAAFSAGAWDAPSGTILVQVSAVPDGSTVFQEWERLQMRYPQVLKPLRLVVEEAQLGGKGVFYRVQAGAFGTQPEAAEACDRLISQGQACFVVVR